MHDVCTCVHVCIVVLSSSEGNSPHAYVHTPTFPVLLHIHTQVMEFYCIPEFVDVHEFLSHVARRHGRLKKGGVPDVDAAAKVVLHDWNG